MHRTHYAPVGVLWLYLLHLDEHGETGREAIEAHKTNINPSEASEADRCATRCELLSKLMII